MLVYGHKDAPLTRPTVILNNIIVASRMWLINDMNVQILFSNISTSHFAISSVPEDNQNNSNLSVNISKTMIGQLILEYVMANISHSQVFKPEVNLPLNGIVDARYASLKLHKVIFNMISLKMSQGVLHGEQSHIEITHCGFLKNTLINSESYYGSNDYIAFGRIFIHSSSELLVYDSQFIANTGPVMIETNSKAQFVRCNFISNQAKYGGAIFAKNNSHVYVSKSSFTSNYACFGGGILVTTNSSVAAENSYFYNNSATGPSEITTFSEGYYKLVFSGRATNRQWPLTRRICSGGAVMIKLKSHGEFSSNCSFERNTALGGGAFLVDGSNLSILDCQFNS